jgi:hypothetical protein
MSAHPADPLVASREDGDHGASIEERRAKLRLALNSREGSPPVQDQDPAEPASPTPSEPEADVEPPPAASAADALADAVLERRRADFKAALPPLLTALFDPPSPPARSGLRKVRTSKPRWRQRG